MLTNWWQDVRYAFRGLRANPLFTTIAALSLAIGIGANTTIFSLANALLLRPSEGITAPERLVDIGRTQGGRGFDTVSYLNFVDLRERTRTLAAVYAYEIEPDAMSLGGEGDAKRVYGTPVSGNFFDVLGVKPQAGRLLNDADDRAGSGAVLVLSDRLWRSDFNANRDIVGRPIRLNGSLFTVIGVAPSGFDGTTALKSDLWVPINAIGTAIPRRSANMLRDRKVVWLMMGGRLAPHISVAQANAELASIGSSLEREYPDANHGKNFRAMGLARFPGRSGTVAGFVALLMVIVSLVLIVACVNLSSMLLARAASRQHEVAVRLAIGASRWRLMRQWMTETAALFALGGAMGLVLTRWMAAGLLGLVPQLPVPVAIKPDIDWRVVSFAVSITAIAAGLSGLAPAFAASATDLMGSLKSKGTNDAPSRTRLRDAFVVAQITASLLLVIVAGLFIRALQHAAAVDPGFDQTNVQVISLDLSLGGYTELTGEPFLRELLRRIEALPGVQSASATADLPLDGGRMGFGGLRVPGKQPPPGQQFFSADANAVEPGFFATMKLPLLRGRDFNSSDTRSSAGVVIVNQALARAFWPGEDALGQHLVLAGGPGEPERNMTVVGVANDARLVSLNEAAEPYFYVPASQQYIPRISILVRSENGSAIVGAVREVLRQIDRNLPVIEAMPLREITAIGTTPQQIAAAVGGGLGTVAVLLACIGLYGVTAYVVSRRTREISIRMALGADRKNILRFVLCHGVRLAILGVAAGLLLGAAGSQLLQSFLFGVRPLDSVVFGGASVLFAMITLAASYVPARRALLVDPMMALKSE